MWPGEHEELTVWADRLQGEGQRLGQLTALGLRAEQLRDEGDPKAAELEAELERSIASEAAALLGPLASAFEFQWQLGVVRSLTLWDTPLPFDELLEALAELVQRPAMRFLNHLHVFLSRDREQLEVLERLARPASIVQPRRIIFDSMPARFRRIRPVEAATPRHGLTWRLGGPYFVEEYVPHVTTLAERGLTWLIRNGENFSPPWAAGPVDTRVQALEQLLAGPWTSKCISQLGCALWDPSIRVRRRLIEAIPTLPDEAAPLLLPLLAIAQNGRRQNGELGDFVERAIAHAATRPVWVRALARNYCRQEPWVPAWLQSISAC